MELTQETRALKEKLLAEVEEIIDRQNRTEPVNLMETF
jgi:predicted house-cleaning noncanonical NTP pyrophosphatase (MazG superfamily)